jgi:hypothetical protein
MKVIRTLGVLSAAVITTMATSARAQNPPFAVPVLGSPASKQPAPPPTPPQVPNQPANIPAQPAPPPQVKAPAAPAALAPNGSRKLALSFKNGTVALDAQNVTLRDVLAEWQRRGGCEFVNADKLPPSTVTLQFPEGTPELTVIDSLLRGLGTGATGYGYIVGPRNTASNDPGCGAVYILPTSRPTASASYMPPPGAPVAAPLVTPGSPDDEIPPVAPFPPGAMPGQPRPVPQNQPPLMLPTGPPPPIGYTGPPQAPPQSPGFGAVPPTAPGAGGIGTPPPTPAPTQPPQQPQGGR